MLDEFASLPSQQQSGEFRASALFRLILDREAIGVAVFEPIEGQQDLRLVYANSEFEKLKPFRPMRGRLYSEIWPELADFAIQRLLGVYETGEEWVEQDIPLQVEAEPGRMVTRYYTYEISRLEYGERRYVLDIASETTSEVELRNGLQASLAEQTFLTEQLQSSLKQQQRLAAEFKTQADQLEAVFDNMTEGVVILSPDGSLVVNDAFARIHGFASKEEANGRIEDYAGASVFDELGRDCPACEWPANKVLRGETFENAVYVVTIPATQTRFVAAYSGRPLRGERGEVVRGILTIHDVTDLYDARELAVQTAERTRILRHVASLAAEGTSLEALSQRVLEECRIRLGAKSGSIYLFDPDAEELVATGLFGFPEELRPILRRIELDEARASARSYIRNKIVRHDSQDLPAGIADRAKAAQAEDNPWLALPIRASAGVLGSLGLIFDEKARPFTDDEMEFFQALSNQLGVGLEKARLIEDLQERDASIRRAYVDVIDAVTYGKLVLMTPDDLLSALGQGGSDPVSVRGPVDITTGRRRLAELLEPHLLRDTESLVLAAAEAMTNALRHGVKAHWSVRFTAGGAQVVVIDEGAGIDFTSLPKATLQPGFSTIMSLGMGFAIMLNVCDRVLLATEAGFTAVVLEMAIASPAEEFSADGTTA